MKLQQIRCLSAVIDQGYSVSRAAAVLHTAQPAVSRQIQLLEEDLRTTLLVRRKTRIVGLTEAGRMLVPALRRVLVDADNVRRQAHELVMSGKRRLIISTSHTYARHTLLRVLQRFIPHHPHVSVQMRESAAPRIMQLLAAGEVDIGITTEPVDPLPGITRIPCYRVGHSLLAPQGHPLLKQKRLSLQQLQAYPLITYDERHHIGRAVRERFKRAGIEPNIVISIIDDDVMKAYVEANFGVAVIPSVAYSKTQDRNLRAVSVDHLFDPGTCVIMTSEGRQMAEYERAFIELVKATPVAGMTLSRHAGSKPRVVKTPGRV